MRIIFNKEFCDFCAEECANINYSLQSFGIHPSENTRYEKHFFICSSCSANINSFLEKLLNEPENIEKRQELTATYEQLGRVKHNIT